MTNQNGGHPYPNVISLQLPDQFSDYSDNHTFLSVINDWNTVVEHWNKKTYGNGTPENFIMLGENPGGIVFLLSLREHDHGKVYLWFHSTFDWGSDENSESDLILQANSFESFLISLHDNTEKEGLEFFGGQEELQRAIKVTI